MCGGNVRLREKSGRASIVAWRLKYMKHIKMHWDNGHSIYYINKRWTDRRLTILNAGIRWSHSHLYQCGLTTQIYSAACRGNWFIPSAQIIYKTWLATGNQLGQMNATDFEKWNATTLAPNLSLQSVAQSR